MNTDQRWKLGLHLLRTGRDEQAMELLRAVVRRDPAHAGAHYNLGVLAAMKHDHPEAVLRYQVLKRLDRDLAWMLREHLVPRE